MSFTYKAVDGAPVLQWEILEYFENTDPDHPDFGEFRPGYIIKVQEKGEVLTIKPVSSSPIRMTKEEAVVLAQDLIDNYGAEVGPITREP